VIRIAPEGPLAATAVLANLSVMNLRLGPDGPAPMAEAIEPPIKTRHSTPAPLKPNDKPRKMEFS
jgi:hypothetical protein